MNYKYSNLKFWDSIVQEHVQSEFYDVPGFLKGKTSLDSVELELVGDVKGQTLLHLQCHFGLSTLSWARLGAITTGVDFSPAAITAANCNALYMHGNAVMKCWAIISNIADAKSRIH